jgi:hypothetical protein
LTWNLRDVLGCDRDVLPSECTWRCDRCPADPATRFEQP